MKLSVNRHAPFDDPERAEVEARVIQRVETDPEKLFELYRQLPESMNGRYINSDLFKEIFPEYAASPAHRTVFNVPVHNSAAVLANALFHQAVATQDLSHGSAVLFVTGIPGAGKTTIIQKADLIHFNDYKVVYEGQLSNFEQASEKIEWCLKHDCEVDVYAFHQKPEIALRHTFNRFNALGRGASIHAMANIQGNHGNSMTILYERFHKQVEFCTLDMRCQPLRPVCGAELVQILKSEGDYDAIRTRLQKELEHWRQAGRISESCFREAAGKPPLKLSEIQATLRGSLRNGCEASGQSGSTAGTCENSLVGEVATTPEKRKRRRMR